MHSELSIGSVIAFHYVLQVWRSVPNVAVVSRFVSSRLVRLSAFIAAGRHIIELSRVLLEPVQQ